MIFPPSSLTLATARLLAYHNWTRCFRSLESWTALRASRHPKDSSQLIFHGTNEGDDDSRWLSNLAEESENSLKRCVNVDMPSLL